MSSSKITTRKKDFTLKPPNIKPGYQRFDTCAISVVAPDCNKLLENWTTSEWNRPQISFFAWQILENRKQGFVRFINLVVLEITRPRLSSNRNQYLLFKLSSKFRIIQFAKAKLKHLKVILTEICVEKLHLDL